MFSEILLDHFQHPRNAGELAEANVKVEVRNPVCGDVLHLAAIVEGKSIREIRFLCRGCTASIACASFLTEFVKGRELSALCFISAESLAKSLGGLPEASFHAAQLAQDALQALLLEAQK
jgi:nitrogen fixation protein NifU and related proteins